ncbi:DUF4268 domain-containing protein [Longimicrobium sp.]|uniref:DUF4268 domain-containing protein n=1 Tax=Longimicrobium sp. TaxID=2029185 RepID=UPI002E378BB9|nr:DUF4268 domain-containing protein [Longimicrobium sp.]HEX6037911.1 DUF4268 domain-containing protein [Longimicrobium sp.]
MAVSIQLLIQGQPPLETITPGATLHDAVARMIEHDFSQLPVVENDRPYGTPASLVTSSSIARALHMFGASLKELQVRDAAIPARTISADEDLFSKMDDLLDDAVLVLNPDGSLAGIVTNYDTTQYFRRRAEDLLLVEDIETTLKDHIRIAYGGDEEDPNGPIQAAVDALSTREDSIREACRKSFRRFCGQRQIPVGDAELAETIDANFTGPDETRRFDDLALSEYIQLASGRSGWPKLEPIFGVKAEAFRLMLDGVRKTRNKLMHFRPDIERVERDRLRFCAEWFKNRPVITPEPGAVDESVASIEQPVEPTLQGDEPAPEREDVTAPASGIGEGNAVESKYAPLAATLARQPRSVERVTLTFEEIEQIIGASLPASARQHRAWWANDSAAHVQSGEWLRVNWRVVSINMTLQRVVFARAHDREKAYIDFFSQVQNRLRELPDFPLHDVNPLGLNWLTLARFPENGLTLTTSFARGNRVRLECYIDTGDAAENESIFESFQQQQAQMEETVGAALEWERLDNRRACRVALYTPGSISQDPEQLQSLAEWVVENAPPFYRAIRQAACDAIQD